MLLHERPGLRLHPRVGHEERARAVSICTPGTARVDRALGALVHDADRVTRPAMNTYQTFLQMDKMLGHLDTWLEKAAAYAQARKVEPATFLGFRLAPDQLPFSRQIHITCDTAKMAASRLTGKEAPVFDDSEKDFDELRARIQATRTYLAGFTAADFEGSEARVVSQPRWEGKVMSGGDYFREHALPNFYFHISLAYSLLRHNGVDLGKKDFLGTLSFQDPMK